MAHGLDVSAGRSRGRYHERSLLQQALLTATAGLLREHDPGQALQMACEALVHASPHIRAAWVFMRQTGDLPMRTVYSAGAVDPALNAADSAEAVVYALQRKAGPQAREQLLCFPIEDSEALIQGGLGIQADDPAYFERIGLEAFCLFADVCAGILQQARLRLRLLELAEFDDVTGLFNRAAMRPILEHVHAFASRNNAPYALVLFDIDRFKAINDQHGHAAGDRVLASVAQRAVGALREADWLSRWGGEEFLAVLPAAEADEALAIAERVRAVVAAAPFPEDGLLVRVTISGGVAAFPLDGTTLEEQLSVADAALYEAKAAGRNRVQRPSARGQRVWALATQIEQALRTGRMRPAYQPIIDLGSGKLVAQEVLARLVLPDEARVLEAAEFIDVAALRHLVHLIDFEIFAEALAHCRAQVARGESVLHFVNVSAGLLRRPELIARLAHTLQATQADCRQSDIEEHPLVLEITERDFLDTREARTILAPFLELGVRLAVDDFGSGYSSFQYLSDLPVNFLKIEGGLVRQARQNRKGEAILRGIRDIACELGLITLAEGVEDAETVDLLRGAGIDWVQGYYFGRPQLEATGATAGAWQRPD